MLYRVGLVAFAVFLSGSDALSVTPPLRRSALLAAHPLRSTTLRLAEAADVAAPAAAGEDCGCDAPEGVVVPTGDVVMNDVRVSGSSLRAMQLTGVDGESVEVGSLIGTEGKAVVVFLRHLG